MFGVPEAIYRQGSAAAVLGFEPAGIPDHLFIYNSDYYRDLIDKANLTDPTELTSTGESIEIQHVCIDRNLPTCVLIQTYWAPNLWERTDGQVDLSVTSFVELGLAGPDTLSQVADGSLDMVNIFTGYVAGAHPSLEVQSLWGTASDWQTSYSALADMAPDIDRMLLDITGGSPVLNRNWFAGSDQWFFSNEPMRSIGDFEGQQIRTHSASMSDFIRGMGGEPVELSVGELYTALQIGTVDAAVTTLLLGVTGSLYEVADHIAGPVIGFGYTNNVINQGRMGRHTSRPAADHHRGRRESRIGSPAPGPLPELHRPGSRRGPGPGGCPVLRRNTGTYPDGGTDGARPPRLAAPAGIPGQRRGRRRHLQREIRSIHGVDDRARRLHRAGADNQGAARSGSPAGDETSEAGFARF